MSPEYEIRPGKGAGPFLLGESLWRILDLLRTDKTEYPKVEIAWDTSKPHKSDLTLTLPNLTLLFPHPLQRLSLIRFTSIPLSNLTLTYEGQLLASSSSPLTRAVVGRALGPTYSGEGGRLVYPGISFELADGSGRGDRVQSLTVQAKDDGGVENVVPLVSAVILPNKGVILQIPDPLEIIIGETTSQDLLVDLGPPLRQYVKEDDRMERMWGNRNGSPGHGVFWNYFQYGLDFLISEDGLVEKIIAHSNIRYARCPWIINTASGVLDHTSPLSAFRAEFAPRASHANGTLAVPSTSAISSTTSKEKKGKSSGSSNSTSAASGTSDVPGRVAGGPQAQQGRQDRGQDDNDAMMLDRVVEGGMDGVENVGTSRLVGFDGLILEEDEETGGITSVLVFRV